MLMVSVVKDREKKRQKVFVIVATIVKKRDS
jgi:hypothetical protein